MAGIAVAYGARMFSRTNARVALSIASLSVLCTGCDVGEPASSVAPPQRTLAPFAGVQGELQAASAERAELPGESNRTALAGLIVRVDAPAALPFDADVAIVAYEPRDFREFFCDPRLLHDELDSEWFRWDPRGQPTISYDEFAVEVRDGRVTIDVDLSGLPCGRRLWLCVYSSWERGWSGYRGFAPVIEELAPLDENSAVRIERVELHLDGAIVGRVVDHTPVASLEESESELDESVDELVVRDLRGVESSEVYDDSFSLWPLTSGAHSIEICGNSSRAAGVAFRSIRTAIVRNGEVTDLGTLEFGRERPSSTIHVVDRNGEPVSAAATVELPESPAHRVYADDGDLDLVGDWRDARSISVEPYPVEEYEPATVAVDAGLPRDVWVVVRERAQPLVSLEVYARTPDGSCAGEPSCFVRPIGATAWVPVATAMIGCGGGWCTMAPIAPGPCEVIAWCPKTSWSCRRTFTVPPRDPDLEQTLVLECSNSRTRVSGALRTTYAGRPHRTRLFAAVTPRELARPDRGAFAYDRRLEVETGRFEIESLPDGVELELLFADDVDDRTIIARRRFELAPGEQLDLGTIEVEIR